MSTDLQAYRAWTKRCLRVLAIGFWTLVGVVLVIVVTRLRHDGLL